MTELYWIDDDFDEMFYIIKGIIKILWRLDAQNDKKVKSIITILGNAAINNDYEEVSEQYRNEAERDIIALYSRACFEIDGPQSERPTYNDKQNIELIEKAIRFFPEDFNEGNSHEENPRELYKKMKQIWGNVDGSFNEEAYQNGQKIVKKFIEKSGICKDSKVGIDIVLMKGDRERINNGNRILSIELYKQLRKREIACFLFSAEGSRDSFVEKCEEIYEKKYKEENGDNLKIFDRKELQGKGMPEFFKELSQILSI